MAKQFWVNNYFIDVTRNQIQYQRQATSIPPKALKVLQVLACRACEVVSHDELMDMVWQDSVVGPNTLQRAIAQLRKAFGDDSKQQAFIKTHAKKGYSLEANVRWQNSESTEVNLANQVNQHKITQLLKSKPHILLAVIVIFIVIAALLSIKKPALYTDITPITASDEQEFNASYSPDGQYLVFNRYEGGCVSHLWAKDLTNNQEQRLSTEPGQYSQLSWSSDGSQLAFVLQANCSESSESTQQCWQLQTLDFARAWNGQSENLLRYDCAELKTSHPTWLNDGRIALLQYPQAESNQAQTVQPELVIYDAITNSLTKLSKQAVGRIYSLAYSRSSNTLATVTLAENNTHVLRTLDLNGKVQTETIIIANENDSVYRQFPIVFSPDGDSFFTHAQGKIYRISQQGDLTLIHPASHTGLWDPSFHPNQPKFAVTFGNKDFDIGYLNTAADPADLEVLSRSTALDVNAKVQPHGKLITFISKRSGQLQLWIIDGDRTYQLSQFEHGLKSSRYHWSPDGQTIALNVNNQVALVKLDGSVNIIDSPVAVSILMPWTKPDILLVTDNQTDQQQLFSIDITTGETTDLQLKNVLWSAYTNDQQIIYADRQTNFWLHSKGRNEPVTQLTEKLFGDQVLLKNHLLYGINHNNQLWSYDLRTNEFAVIKDVHKNIIYISDIKDQVFLATKFMGGRRELVEYSQQ